MTTPASFKGDQIQINKKDYTIDRYISDTYLLTAQNLIITSVFCGLALYVSPFFSIRGAIISVLFSFLIGIVFLVCIHEYKPYIELNKRVVRDHTARKIYSYVFFASQGIIISPLVYTYSDYVYETLILSSALTIGTIVAANSLPKGSMIIYGSAIYTGLLGCLGIGIISIFVPSFYYIEPFLGIMLFCACNIYDTQLIMESYEDNKIDPMAHSVNYGLNFINIFTRLLRIIGRSKKE